MSQWVIALLVVYVTLGLSRINTVKASRLALVVTAFVVAVVMARIGAGA